MYRIYKEVKISAGHSLEGLPAEHPCSRWHGHNYRIEVWIEGAHLSRIGWLLDFGFIGETVAKYDHQNLNKMMNGLNPTAEIFAAGIHQELVVVTEDSSLKFKVRVWETDTSWAEVE